MSKEILVSMGSGGGTTAYHVGVGLELGLPEGMELGGYISGAEEIGLVNKARRLKKPCVVVDRSKYAGTDLQVDEYGYGQALIKAARGFGGTVVSLNGFLDKVPGNFINAFEERIFNQHPGPKKETRATHGVQPHAIMLELARLTGRNEGTDVVIHRVDEEWDHGVTVARSHVNILEEDTPESLQAIAMHHEYLLQVWFWSQFMKGDVKKIPDQIYMRPGEEKLLGDIRKSVRQQYPHG